MNLRNYEHTKFAVAEILRAALNIVPPEDYSRRERFHELFVRLAEDRFNLVVVGRFNRGKTSIMNAILKNNRLPVGIIPLTSVITTVSYGTTERVVLRFRNSSLTSDIPILALPQYVTQAGNPGNARGIKMAEVKLRAEILRRGFHFVDTPGLGSAIVENTLTTESFLPEADAFLLVTGYESPLSEEEVRFLRGVSSSARRIFVIINKHDTITAQQRETIMDFVRAQLRDIFGENPPQVFSVSASEGLTAKLAQDPSRLSASGIPALEEALVGFLLTEKKDHFLRLMCRRGTDLIGTLAPSPDAIDLTVRMRSLSDRIDGDSAGLAEPLSTTTQEGEPTLQQLNSCEVCSHVNDALWNFECAYQCDISTDSDAKRRFVAAGGLCSFHTWQYQRVASPYGICTAYPELLDRLAGWLRSIAGSFRQDGLPNSLQIPEAVSDHCVMCSVRAKAEAGAIARLALQLSRQGDRNLSSLSAICLPHLAMLCSALPNPKDVPALLYHQAMLLEHVSEDMRRYTLKRDATRRFLETKEEAAAAERALLLVAGHRNVTASRGKVPSNHSFLDSLATAGIADASLRSAGT